MSHIALLALSLGVLCVGLVLAMGSTRSNVTAIEHGVTRGRVGALVAVLAILGGLVGAGVAVVLALRG